MKATTIWVVFRSSNTAAIPVVWRMTEEDALSTCDRLRKNRLPNDLPLFWALPVSDDLVEVT